MHQLKSSEQCYLALDQGGHSSRAIIFDHAGEELFLAKHSIGVNRLKPGWVEQDAEALAESVFDVLHRALDYCQQQKIALASIGLATQRSNVVCWNKNTGEVLSPAISWQDRRAHQWLHQFEPHRRDIHKTTGLFITAHYGASKLRWCLDNLDPVREAYEAGDLYWGPLASFLIYRLSQERHHIIDPANASRTLLWSLEANDWHPGLLKLFGVPGSPLPQCVESIADYGSIQYKDESYRLSVVTGDQPAALLAFGRPDVNTAYINMGTGAFIQRPTGNTIKMAERLLSGVVMSDGNAIAYDLECTVNGAGSALTAVEEQLGIDCQYAEEHFSQWLSQSQNPPLFLNGVSGLGTPYWIADFESTFIGDGESWEKIVAVAESIIFLVQVNLTELQSSSGKLMKLVVTGGLAANDGLCQRLADLSRLPIFRPEECEATARGTAYMMAGCPKEWGEHIEGQSFVPEENESLDLRFIRWSNAMQHAVCQHGKV